MADEHWSDEDYEDEALQDDWESLMKADEEKTEQEKAEKKAQEEEKKRRQLDKEEAARKKALKNAQDNRAPEELTKNRKDADQRLRSNAAGLEQAADATGSTRKLQLPDKLTTDDDVQQLTQVVSETILQHSKADGYENFFEYLTKDLAQKEVKQDAVAELLAHFTALKNSQKHKKPVGGSKHSGEERHVQKDGNILEDVGDRAGRTEGEIGVGEVSL